MAEERPILARDVKTGDKHYYRNITFEIVEVMDTRDFNKRPMKIISYRIIDRDFVSPVAHLFLYPHDNVRNYIKQVIDTYLQARSSIRR